MMLTHPVSPQLVEHILLRETRKRVLARTFDRQEFTAEHIDIMRSRALLNPDSAEALLNAGRYPVECEPTLLAALLDPDSRQVHALTSRHQFDQDAMLAGCPSGRTDAFDWAAGRLLGHPNAGPDVVAAAARKLGPRRHGAYQPGRVQRELVAHLPAISRPWELVDTGPELDLLRRRRGLNGMPHVTTARVRDHAGPTPDAVIENAANQRLDQAGDLPTILETGRQLNLLLEASSPDAWDTVIPLLDGRYTGTAADLIATANALGASSAPSRPIPRSITGTRPARAAETPAPAAR
jgi:hypothetical protein